MNEEWGPWIEHDGKGCPCVGQVVHIVIKLLDPGEWVNVIEVISETEAIEIADGLGSWTWDYEWNPIIRYRIRKPRGMTILEGLLENLPEEVDA